MRGILVSGGNLIDKDILINESKNSYIICADCGIRNFYNTDILPDLIVGDLDSTNSRGMEFIKENNLKVEKYPPKKNLTDTELALSYLIDKKCDEIILLSATGTRLDHSISNVFLLEYLDNLNIIAKIIDNNNEIEIRGQGVFSVNKKNYKYLSVIALSDYVVYSTTGMEYETDHLEIKRYSARGVSNEIKAENAEILIHKGKAIIIHSKD